jgi:cell division protein FtsL
MKLNRHYQRGKPQLDGEIDQHFSKVEKILLILLIIIFQAVFSLENQVGML